MESEEKSIEEVETEEVQSDEVAKEECLFSLATLALELEAGSRGAATPEEIAQAIFVIFKAHDVEEILEEARLFSSTEDDEADAGEDGEEADEEDE